MRNQVNIPRTYFDHGQRRDEFLYDEVSFAEAWKNAIIHNNYENELDDSTTEESLVVQNEGNRRVTRKIKI